MSEMFKQITAIKYSPVLIHLGLYGGVNLLAYAQAPSSEVGLTAVISFAISLSVGFGLSYYYLVDMRKDQPGITLFIPWLIISASFVLFATAPATLLVYAVGAVLFYGLGVCLAFF